MGHSIFDRYHPTVPLVYFLCVLSLSMIFFEPVSICLALAAGLALSGRLRGAWQTLRDLRWQLPFAALICLINPLFSAEGSTVLLSLGPSKVYAESLAYGFSMGALFVAVYVWSANMGKAITTSKVQACLGRIAPTLALILSMTLRLIPEIVRRGHEINALQKANTATRKASSNRSSDKTISRTRLLSVLVGWSLELSFGSADSMRARGWNCGAKRTSYQQRRFRAQDGQTLSGIIVLAVLDALALAYVCSSFHFYPTMTSLSPWWYYLPHAALLGLPLIGQASEDITWSLAQSHMPEARA